MIQRNVYVADLNQVTTTDVNTIGAVYSHYDPNDFQAKSFIWCKYVDGAVAATVGAALGWVSRVAQTVTADVTTTEGGTTYAVVAGVVQRFKQDGTTAYVPPADGEFFWLQIYGPSPVLAAAPTGSTPAIGDSVVLSATDSLFKVDPVANQIASIGGYLTNVTASSETVFLTNAAPG